MRVYAELVRAENDTNPKPIILEITNLYRPGSIVIRVANFNDMSDCTGGQVLDNYTSGQVLVWWANNSTSACWPQDLYKVNRFENVLS